MFSSAVLGLYKRLIHIGIYIFSEVFFSELIV